MSPQQQRFTLWFVILCPRSQSARLRFLSAKATPSARNHSEYTTEFVDGEVQDILECDYVQTLASLRGHSEELVNVAWAPFEKEVIGGPN